MTQTSPAPSTARPSRPADDGVSRHVLGEHWWVRPDQSLGGAGGGLPAFAAADLRGGRARLMAVEVQPDGPARAGALVRLSGGSIGGVLTPLAHGVTTGPAPGLCCVVTQAPPGPALWPGALTPPHRFAPWSEAELLNCVLLPAAAALEALRQRQVPHRAIRPDNLFHAGPGAPIVLGCAWAAPPAMHQPALFEPPYSAMCRPSCRGDGSIADDVYALGVVLLLLTLGRVPLADLDDAAIIRRKLELGSFNALAGGARINPGIADLVRGMLAEDPDHRPLPALLSDPSAARARRVAARPPRRAQRPLELGSLTVWDARTLAYAVASDPDPGMALLRSGAADHWLRRNLGNAALAGRLEEAARLRTADADEKRADAMLAMRAVAILDPLAPLCWRGLALWPDGLGPALAEAMAEGGAPGADSPEPAEDSPAGKLRAIVASEAVSAWAACREERCDVPGLRQESRQQRTLLRLQGWAGGLPRLRYALNPLLPCRSPVLRGRKVVRLPELLPALEAAAADAGARGPAPLDRDVAAFLAARHGQRVEGDLAAIHEDADATARALAPLRILASLQAGLHPAPLPGLAGWLVAGSSAALEHWHNRRTRERLAAALAELAGGGQLGLMLALLCDPAARAADCRGLQQAQASVRRIDRELEALAAGSATRAETAQRIGQEVATAAGLAALSVAVVAMLLG
jgi:eukaryotic-like serine/threonine-protein kinase